MAKTLSSSSSFSPLWLSVNLVVMARPDEVGTELLGNEEEGRLLAEAGVSSGMVDCILLDAYLLVAPVVLCILVLAIALVILLTSSSSSFEAMDFDPDGALLPSILEPKLGMKELGSLDMLMDRGWM